MYVVFVSRFTFRRAVHQRSTQADPSLSVFGNIYTQVEGGVKIPELGTT